MSWWHGIFSLDVMSPSSHLCISWQTREGNVRPKWWNICEIQESSRLHIRKRDVLGFFPKLVSRELSLIIIISSFCFDCIMENKINTNKRGFKLSVFSFQEVDKSWANFFAILALSVLDLLLTMGYKDVVRLWLLPQPLLLTKSACFLCHYECLLTCRAIEYPRISTQVAIE